MPARNLGHILAVTIPNRICGQCELQIDLRPLPGMKIDTLRVELSRLERLAKSELKLELVSPSMASRLWGGSRRGDCTRRETLTGHPAGVPPLAPGAYLNRLGARKPLSLVPGDIVRPISRMGSSDVANTYLR